MAAAWRLRGYDVERCLGVGGSGEVWRARVISSGDAVALKRLTLHDAEQAQRALAEAAKLRVLDHPHLVRLHDTVLDGACAVLVLDLADGGSLAELLQIRGRLSPGEVITAIAPVAAALAHVHAAGVVHGDVSAANILFTPNGLPLLADLGVARLTGDDADAESTPAYVDPLIARGGVPTSHTDVYMLAAVAVHALTGAPLWSADSADEALELARVGDTSQLEARLTEAGLEPTMVAVLRRALHAEPFRRGSAADLALDLRHSGRPVAVELGAGRPREEVVPPRQPAEVAERWPDPGPPRFPTSRAAVPPVSDQPVPTPATLTRPRSGGRHAAVPVPPRARRRDQSAAPRPRSASRTADGSPAPDVGVGESVVRRPDRAADPGADSTDEPTWRPPPTNAIARRRPTLPAPRRRPPVRALAAAGGVLLVLAAIAVVAVLWRGGGSEQAVAVPRTTTRPHGNTTPRRPSTSGPAATAASSPPAATSAPASPTPTSTARGWVRALRELDATRTEAFATRNAGLFDRVYLPGPLRSADVAALRRLVPAGCGLLGVRTSFGSVTTRAGPRAATVTAVARLPVSRLVCHGAVTGHAPAVGPTRLRITLVEFGGQIRIASEQVIA